jgi:drug/metabolite transporter (DMT)-like permease
MEAYLRMSNATGREETPSWRRRLSGINSSLLASFLLGWAPILGKFAYRANVDPTALAALRTIVAAGFLWLVYVLFWRRRIRLPYKAILGCILVGTINGIGSLFYYNGLNRLDASRASLLGAMYPVWVVIFLSASGQSIRGITLLQLAGSMLGAFLVTSSWRTDNPTDYLGAMLMIASAAVNGWYIVMGQWVLADVPSQSGALYILTGMAATVVIAQVITGHPISGEGISSAGWRAIGALGMTTALSRLAMFFSIEKLGGVQTAILSLIELAISLALAFVFLGDRLLWHQWVGAILLLGGGVLARLAVEQEPSEFAAFDPMKIDH